jgi:hypothetical protein
MNALVVDPLAQPLFARTFVTAGALLGAILAALCVVERRHLREAPRRVLFQRWLTWLVITPVYALAVLSLRFNPWSFDLPSWRRPIARWARRRTRVQALFLTAG